MSIYSIYKCVNKINNKVYIGFDSKWPARKNSHKAKYKKYNFKFYRAICKHGWENFEWYLLYQSKDLDYTLNVMESHFITEYNSFKSGYNSTTGGEGRIGFAPWNKGKTNCYSTEHNNNISSQAKKRYCDKTNHPMYGRKHTDESRKVMSKSARSRDSNYLHKKIITPDGTFNSCGEAASYYNKSASWISKQLKQNSDFKTSV
jgi:group I intron endonuclease